MVFCILVGGHLLELGTWPAVGSLYATGRHRYYAAQKVGETLACVALACFLGAKFGMNGVALGIVSPIMLSKVSVQPLVVARNLGLGFWTYWGRVIAAPSCVAAVLIVFLRPVSTVLMGYSWWTLPPLLVFSLLMASLLLWYAVLERHERSSALAVAGARFRAGKSHLVQIVSGVLSRSQTDVDRRSL